MIHMSVGSFIISFRRSKHKQDTAKQGCFVEKITGDYLEEEAKQLGRKWYCRTKRLKVNIVAKQLGGND